MGILGERLAECRERLGTAGIFRFGVSVGLRGKRRRIGRMSKTPDDGKIGADGPGEMERRGLEAAGFGELGSLTRVERAEKYQRDMKPHFDKQLMDRRVVQVKNHRENPRGNLNVDDKWDRWYVAEEWTDAGVYVGDEPCVKALNPDPAAINTPDEKAAKLAAWRAALAGVEGRLGVKPVVLPPAADVTKPPETCHETPVADQTAEGGFVTKEADVTKPVGGRPPKVERPLSPAERKRLERAKKKGPPA